MNYIITLLQPYLYFSKLFTQLLTEQLKIQELLSFIQSFKVAA